MRDRDGYEHHAGQREPSDAHTSPLVEEDIRWLIPTSEQTGY